jgi:hypothetical protein
VKKWIFTAISLDSWIHIRGNIAVAIAARHVRPFVAEFSIISRFYCGCR